GTTLNAKAKAFLADVECTAPYDEPLAMITTNMFQANHEDAYDSDVDEGLNANVAFMENLTSKDINKVVSMYKMKDKQGHVRPESGFYAKLNAIKFVPRMELSREQAYWLNSQDHTPSKPVTPFVRKGPPPSQVLASLHLVKVVFP
nr:hypothetical protein [Tanacetum cinerariifolium]